MQMTINNMIQDILSITDDVTFRDLISIVDKLREEGYTDESIVDSLSDIKHRLLMISIK